MKRFRVISLVLSFFFVLSACNKTLNISTYYGEYADSQRTSYKDVEGLRKMPEEIGWRCILSEADEVLFDIMDAPTIEENRVFMVSGSVISCVNLDTGKEVWKKSYPELFPPDSEFDYSPVVYGDKLIVVEGFPNQQYLATLDKNTGELLWKSKRIGDMEVNLSLIHISSPRDRTRSRMPSSA